MVDDTSEHKKPKGVNRNVVKNTTLNEYKDVLLSQNYLRHSMNRVQCKNHRIGTYQINKILLLYLDNEIYIQSNGYDGLALTIQKQLFLSSLF